MIDLLAKLKALPILDHAEEADLSIYPPLALSENALPDLLEIASPGTSMYQEIDDEDEEEIWSLLSAANHARAILANFENPDHFTHFLEMLVEAEERDDEGYYTAFPWFIKKLGPSVIDEMLTAFAREKQTTNVKQSLAKALVQFSGLNDSRLRIVETLRHGFETNDQAYFLNNQLVQTLIAYKGVEAIAQITDIDNEGLLDHRQTGDLEEIKIALGLADERKSLIPSDEPNHSFASLSRRKETIGTIPENATSEEIIDYYLSLYRSSGSIANHVELQGFFAAEIIKRPLPQYSDYHLDHVLWSGHDSGQKAIPWLSAEDEANFHDHAHPLYLAVFEALSGQNYKPAGNLTSWIRGFLLSMKDQDPATPALSAPLEKLTSTARAASATPSPGDRAKITQLLNDYVNAYEEHKEQERLRQEKIGKPIRREAPKMNRNDPCSCGSGKKFKKCCMP